MHTLFTLDPLAKKFASSRDHLSSLVTTLQTQLEAIKRAALPEIRKAVARAAEHQAALHDAIDGSRPLFDKPRTIILYGIKIGLAKSPGKVQFENEEQVIALIKKRLPKLQDSLIHTKESVSKTELKKLDAQDLLSIACTLSDAGDHIILSPVDDAVDKLVSALLADALDSAQSAAA